MSEPIDYDHSAHDDGEVWLTIDLAGARVVESNPHTERIARGRNLQALGWKKYDPPRHESYDPWACPECGALVSNPYLHMQWHEKMNV